MTTALVIVGLIALAAVSVVVWLLLRGGSSAAPINSDISVLQKTLELLLKDTQNLKSEQRVAQEAGQHIKTEMRQLTDVLSQFKTRQEERDRQETEYNMAIQSSVKNIESLFRGSKSKGIAGESILREILKVFPPELIVFDYPIEGKPVEFGLKLADGKIVPMDSKIVALEELTRLETETNEDVRSRLIKKAELEVAKKIKEVASYIHPPTTYEQAIMLIPDLLYSVLKEAPYRASQHSVILLSYSMAVPYILTLRHLHSRTLATYDEQQVTAFLDDLGRILNEMEDALENKLTRGNTMITNATGEYRQMLSRIRGRISRLAEASHLPELVGSTKDE
ncbi:MAG: DNA recombination protein RmuC [Patescibacteria group bacterium]|jgi:DNA recombination protein RmuC